LNLENTNMEIGNLNKTDNKFINTTLIYIEKKELK
jgi:hypothetical protein